MSTKLWFNSCFVKQKDIISTESDTNTTTLDGQHIQEFYDNVMAKPDESSHPKVNTNVTQNKNVNKSVVQIKALRSGDNGIKREDIFKMCQNGDFDGCVEWLQMGFDVNTRDQYLWTPLMCSACAGHENIVRLFIDNKADTTAADKSGKTVLDLALIGQHKHICDLIIKHKNNEFSDKTDTKLQSIRSAEEVGGSEPKTCDICHKQYNGCDVQHKCSIVHQINVKSGHKFNKYYELSESNKGFQMLLRSGWSREEGLGPDGQGVRVPVKTVLKRDRLGLGLKDPKNKPKVTHFTSFDTKAVDNKMQQNIKRYSKSQRDKSKTIRLKQMEIRYRREFK